MLQKTGKPDYGQDVPDMVKSYMVRGEILMGAGSIVHVIARLSGQARRILAFFGSGSLLVGAFLFIRGLLLIKSSRINKIQIANNALDDLGLKGDETVLDVGCGHGVLLINAAKRLPRGRAIGVDLWSNVDQEDNNKEATLYNAEVEGVTDRVEIHDGDMRDLSFLPDASVDAVVAYYAIHNIPNPEGRRRAISEIVRVLKPGGQVAIMDIFFVQEFVESLQDNGMQYVRILPSGFLDYPPVRIIKGVKV